MDAQQLSLFDLDDQEAPKTQKALFDVAETLPTSPRIWLNYRRAGDLGELIKDAVAEFYQQRGALPAGVRVNPKNLDKTRAALIALDLANLAQQVQPNGGTLACEVELALVVGVL